MYNQILSASNSEFKKALEVNTCRSTAPLTMSSSYDRFNFHRKIYSYVSKYREKKIPFLKILTFSNSVIFLDCLQLEFNVCVCVCVPSNINKKSLYLYLVSQQLQCFSPCTNLREQMIHLFPSLGLIFKDFYDDFYKRFL